MTKKTMTGAMRILASMLVAAALATERLLRTPAAILVLFAALPAQASDDWNTAAFFQQATPAAVQERLEAGAKLEARAAEGMTPLHCATRTSAHPGVVSTLLDAGTDPQARDAEGLPPVDHAQDNEARF